MSALKTSAFLITRGVRLLQTRGYAEEMKLTLAAANQTFYDNSEVHQIDVPSFSGNFGILAQHVPTLAVLKPGTVEVFEKGGSTKKIFVSSGIISVNEDSSVQVLAEEGHPIENLDGGECRKLLGQYQQQLGQATTDVARAEANIAIEVCEALIKATE